MVAKRVSPDTSFLVALYNPYDSLHKRAIGYLKQHQGKQIVLLLHPLVLIETLTVLKKRLDPNGLRFCEQELFDSEKISVLEVTFTFTENSLAVTIFNQKNDLSVIDAIVVEYCTQTSTELLTFDAKQDKAYRKLKH